ncbi:hypothetical protein L596_005737 [Steinernema carpocapsae]|uniref:Zasp-like motif domain-containing protein n=1 Tax=Steinernema carpocapsae TaxID=34508 RepID=A0A4U8V5H8_STECR|nr:hypothetical protein L596_005737 [Steinernema carpocapsae]
MSTAASSVVLVEGVPVPAKLAAAFQDRRDPSKVPFSYTAPLPPSLAVPTVSRLSIPRVLPIVPPELLDELSPEPVDVNPAMTHMQYNSPMPLYSRESAEEQYRQQMGQLGNNVPNIGSSEKHFDPEKSATLRAIQEQDMEDQFGKNFFEKVAVAEAPKVPLDAGLINENPPAARERSQRARSHTPAAAQYQYQPPQPGATMMPPPTNAAPQYFPFSPRSPRSHVNYGASFTHSDKIVPERGYQFGGLDYTSKSTIQDDGYYYPPYPSRPKTPVREEKPGYKMGGTDFAENTGNYISGYNPNYHGHGPEPPRMRSVFSADPHAPVNTYVSPNVEGVNPIRLVGDTISNQKCRYEKLVTAEDKANFGTSFAPPEGHRPEHRAYPSPPKQQEPVCFSLSAKKSRGHSAGGFYGSQVRAHSAAPGLGREQWTAEKEVTVETLLNDDALRPIRRSMTPDWAGRSQQKHDNWRHTLDPRFNRPQCRQRFSTRNPTGPVRSATAATPGSTTQPTLTPASTSRLRPRCLQQPPYWASRANTTHRVWQTAADQNIMGGQQQGQYGAGYGGQYGGSYGNQSNQDGYGYGSQQQQNYQQQHAPQQNGYQTEQKTSYSYSSQQAPIQTTPLQMDQASFTKNRVTTETTTTAPSQPIAMPAPTSGGQYQQFSSSEKHIDKRSQEQQHEERMNRPVSYYEEQKDHQRSYRKETSEQRTVQQPVVVPQSRYEEQRDFQRSYKKETSEQRTVQPLAVAQNQVQSTTVSNDAFDRRAEMNETLPRGTLSNTQANATGGYVDGDGRNVSYKRELTTSADPGKEYQLLKEEERRVVEQPLEPGVISRHVTTKYYKKKTVTDTQQTMTQ